MNSANIIKRLDLHSIQTRINNGQVEALEEWTKNGKYGCQWIDVTGWTTRQVYDWLGY